jgi:hypothetical protein
MPQTFDLNSMSDEDAESLGLMLEPQEPPPMPQAPKPQLPPGSFDLNDLSDDDATSVTDPMGSGEATARLLGHHLSFGLADNLIGRDEIAQAEREHPLIDIGTGIGSAVAQTAVLGPLAVAGKGYQVAANAPRLAKLAGSAVRGAGKVAGAFVPNMKAKTAVQAGLTGSKVGATYSGATSLGSGLTNEDKTTAEALGDAAWQTAGGGIAGGILGPTVHAASRGVGAIANRVVPGLRDVMKAAQSKEAEGIRDLWRNAGYDDVDFDKLAAELALKPPPGVTAQQADEVATLLGRGLTEADVAAQTRLAPDLVANLSAQERAIQSRYGNLNLVEAIKMGKLRPQSTGELKPEVVTTRNLDKFAQDNANTQGRGANVAAANFGARKNEMSAMIQNDVDDFFGSGTRVADADALVTRKSALGKRYQKMRDKGPQVNAQDLGKLQAIPVFRKALETAATNDMIELGVMKNNPWDWLWSGNKMQENLFTLSPSNVLDIHHALVVAAKPPITGATPETVMAGKLKDFFSKWVDHQYSKHAALRRDFAQFKRVTEATEAGAELPLAGGGSDHKSLVLLGKVQRDAEAARRLLNKEQARMAMAAAAGATPKQLATHKGRVTVAQNGVNAFDEIVDEFRRSWGNSIKEWLASKGENGPLQAVRALTTQEGKRRILQVLGPEKGKQFIERLYNKEMQGRLGNTLYGGPDTAYKMDRLSTRGALWKAVTGLAQLRPMQVVEGLGEAMSKNSAQLSADRVNETLSQQGVPAVRKLLGSLQQQNALRTTAHPYIRNPALKGIGPIGASTSPSDEFEETLLKEKPVKKRADGGRTLGEVDGYAEGGAPKKERGFASRLLRAVDPELLYDAGEPGMEDDKTRGLPGTQSGVSRETVGPRMFPVDKRPGEDLGSVARGRANEAGVGAGAAATGALDTATFGLGTPPSADEFMAEHPVASGVGSVAGIAAPFGAVARGVSQLPKAAKVGLGALGSYGAMRGSATGGDDVAMPDQLQQLIMQKKELARQRATAQQDADDQRNGNRAKGIKPGRGDNYTSALQTVQRYTDEMAALDSMIAEQMKRSSPEYAMELKEKERLTGERIRKEKLDQPFNERHPYVAGTLAAAAPVSSALMSRYFLGKIANTGMKYADDLVNARKAGDVAGIMEATGKLDQWNKWYRMLPKQAAAVALPATAPMDARVFGDLMDKYTLPESSKAQQRAVQKFSDIPTYAKEGATAIGSGLIGAGIGAKFAPSAPRGEARALLDIYGPNKKADDFADLLTSQAAATSRVQEPLALARSSSAARGASDQSTELLQKSETEALGRSGAERAALPPPPKSLGEVQAPYTPGPGPTMANPEAPLPPILKAEPYAQIHPRTKKAYVVHRAKGRYAKKKSDDE